MKTLILEHSKIFAEGRWDIDFHLPSEGIKVFDIDLLKQISKCADVVKEKRDPTKNPESEFDYIDISCVSVDTGMIENPQRLVGAEAPSRARKVVHASDIIISTCRPTRGAIAVVGKQYHNQICSTGFSVIRPKAGVNPFFLHYAIRLSSTLEQFRKWSTGSSYPAILDDDVMKTLIPIPKEDVQNIMADRILAATHNRNEEIKSANRKWIKKCESVTKSLIAKDYNGRPKA